ncbi:histone-lysine N-methyltransferase 2B-like isoform X2 [Seriola lalandi dorsalis]|uniref:histone-lysine N-methyltransferase 2B-like isoform X2 n=1 Tax=Seriola lalandi dorsalis TaxID=1841481 RepID=UPI000C6F5F7B|nr:histone-lysine N-methyltransferase 2B-like isoform X2 [Seriola lalandi dorsalis]
MAASGGGLSSPATVAGLSTQAPARARFPGRPCTARSRLRSEKRTRRGRLGSDNGELAAGGPRPVNIGLALSEDPSLLRLLGVAEKHRRQKDAGFDSSNSEEEEDFTGFGTTTVRPQKTSGTVPRSLSLSHSPGTKSLIGKILPKSPKPALIGKIVPRAPKEGQGAKDSPVEDKEIPKVVIKLHGKQVGLTAKAKHADEQASGRQSSKKSVDFVKKAGETADSGNSQNQTAATSAGGTKQNKLVSTVTAVKGTEKASKVKEQGEVSEDSDTDQSQPQSSVKQMKRFRFGRTRRTSQAVALSFTSFHKRQKKRMAKGMGASPEAGAEAGAQSGEEAAMPLECKAEVSSEKRTNKRPRRSLFGHRRKAKPTIRRPKLGRTRTRRVFYTYITEPVPAAPTQDGNEQQLQGQNITPSEGEPSSFSEQVQQSSNSSTPVMSARSSRVIKAPKRFLDEEMIPFPKGPLSTWLKSQQREDGKASASHPELGYDGNSLQSDSDSLSAFDSPSAVPKFSSKPSPGTSHLEIYKNLKKLTLKLAEKKKGQPDTQGDYTHHGDGLTSHVRKRRRSKLMMEEMESPGVVRKLAVVVNADVEAPSHMPFEDIGNNNQAGGMTGDSQEALEVSGPSHRIGLSGANKRMLHLLKKAKVQLIKIDQQKQLKLSQLGSRESRVPVSGRRRRRRRVGASPKDTSPQEQPLGGPRIKHVCRAAAVALGQPRAMVPDDIPRLSALPLHEREGITFSPTAEDVADDDDDISDQGRAQWVVSQENIQRRRRGRGKGHKFRKRKVLSRYAPGGVRARRCGRCPGCLIEDDCAKCVNCLDKPKFGGPNTKRQCCIYKKCERIEKAKIERIVRPFKVQARRLSGSVSSSDDANWGFGGAGEGSSSMAPGVRKQSLRNITPRSYSSLLKSESESEGEEGEGEEDKTDKSTAKPNVAAASNQDLAPQDGGSVPDDPPAEAVKHRRPFSRGTGSRPRAHKEQENTEETEPRETFPETSPSRRPLPKLQQQLQIHLLRLPDFILQSALSLTEKLPQCLDQCAAQMHPELSQPVTQTTTPSSSEFSEPITQTTTSYSSHSTTPSLPLSQPVMQPASPLSPHAVTDYPQKSLLLRLHRLPQSVVQSALHLHKCTLSSSQEHPQSILHSALTVVSSKLCFQGHPESEVQHPDESETNRANKQTVPKPPQTVGPGTELQEGKQEEQEDEQVDQPEEEEDASVKETVLKTCPTTDPQYVLRSQNPAECASVNTLTGLTNGFPQKGLLQNKYKIRVDFKEDCAVQNVWLMGGLSVLTSVPTTPQPVCLLCASKGRHEMIFCQICCEPFHSFCLLPEERPKEENKENWCCRRCKFCHVCGRRSKSTKPVLQCRRCHTSYHPSCLGPTYPKPMNCSMPWVCMTCIRCKSCGVTPGKSWDLAWNHEQDLCPDCTSLHSKGNFCTVCHKCYDDNKQHTQMIQCSKCNHWIHYLCEGLSEELFGLLSSQRGQVVFTCSPCGQRRTERRSLKEELQSRLIAGLGDVLTHLLNDDITKHLLICKACQETNDSGFVREQRPVCDLQVMEKKFKGGGYTSIKTFHADVISVMRKWLKKEELLPENQRLTSQARTHYVKLVERVFTWFPARILKKWSSFSEEFPSGMLPEAVLPPSKEHSYAQWLERTYQPKESRGHTAGKTLLSSLTTQQPGASHSLPLHSHGVKDDQETTKSKDMRQCALCQQYGDSAPNDAGRLLYLGQNEWAHINCCLWSAEVYEDNSALLQVHSAVSRGRHLRCDRCGQSGATVGCCLATCQSNFHFMCARAQNCVFQQDRKMYCYKHRDLVSAKMVSGKGFEVPRRVYVDFEGINFRRKFLTGLEPESINMTIGSLQIQKLGVLSELSSNGRMLYPVGYQCSRLYWSTVDPRRRCKYTCKVTEVSTPLPGEEQDPRWDQEENHTIVHSPKHHRDMESPDRLSSTSSPIKSTTPSPNSKLHNTPGSKSPGYTQTRRPAGGSFRPLPSPGSAPPKSHHILTLRDLEDTRRPRRLSSRSRCSSSPTDSDPSVPMTLRSGGTVHSRCALFSSPPRSSSFGPASPPLSRQNSTSPVWSSPPRSNSSISAGLSPRQGAITHSPKGRQNFKITTPVSAEVPQDFLASSEAEDAAVATTNGISLAPDNLEEEVAHLMSQELPYTVFDTDTEVAVASMLNAKLEFDEALLTENVVLHCGAQGGRGEVEGVVQDVEMQEHNQENDSEDEDSSHYFKFSRTVVCDAASGSDASGQLASAQSISQLDGADSGSESDESEVGNDEAQDAKIHNHNTPTKQLTIALKRLESIYTVSKSTVQQGATEPEFQENSPPSALLESDYVHDEMSVQEEEVPMSSEIPTSHNDLLLDSATGHFVSAGDGSVLHINNQGDDKDDSVSSADSVDGFKDDLNDPDYSPESKTKKSPTAQMKTIVVKTKRPTSNLKRLSPKPYLPQQHKLKLLLPSPPTQTVNNASVSSAAATFCTVPRTLRSPIVINGLNALPIQPGAKQSRTIAIRLDSSKPGSRQQVVTPNQAAATDSPPSSAPSPQVLLVNRQGQILIKDPRSNTYQSLNTNSPTYSKISQIAKILHSGNALQRSVPRVIIKPRSNPSATSTPAASNHTTTAERKIIVRVVPVKSGGTPTSTAPTSVRSVTEPGLSNIEESTAQAIIDRAMATHRHAQRTKPIILSNPRQPKVRHRRSSQFQDAEDSDQSPEAFSELPSSLINEADLNSQPTPASSRHQVRVKRVSSVSERPSRKKSKMDFLMDPSSEVDDVNEARSSGVRMKAPTMKDILDLDQKIFSDEPEPLRITAPPPPTPSRRSQVESPPTSEHTNSHSMSNTHMWVSARHGDLSEWGPYSGFSSEEDAPAPRYRKRTYMNQPHLRFEITSEDGFSVKANSIEVAWRAVIDGVLEARAAFHLKQLPLGGMSGPRVLGVVHDAVIFLLEQLQGAANCKQHRFRFHRCDDIEEELPLNPSGSARAEIYTRKATFDMFNFLASQHREPPDIIGPFDEEEDEFPLKSSRRATSSELPMAMRFRHLEKLSKEAVGVYRSQIHGRGLFCKRNIEAGEMVIEYAGTVIRSVLTDKREKYYDSKGIGCYMFRIDDFDVVDATMQGNAARFINHSCEPNCYSRVINVDGRKHIVIFALRKIYRGEELTYDYKFPIEDEDNKLHCNCGTRRCRRFLN